VPEEFEAWELKAETEGKEKKDAIRMSLRMAGFDESELEKMEEEECEAWERKADEEANERKTEIAETLKFLGLDTKDLDLDSLESWEKKALTEKPLDAAYLATHPQPQQTSILSSIFGLFSFSSQPAPIDSTNRHYEQSS
jgi:hypothetical protein